MTIYVAPTEPEKLRAVADTVSQHPERFGVDVLINGSCHTVGIQRKTVSDLVASLADGRLAEQHILMSGLGANNVVVLIEGPVRFVNEQLRTGSWGETLSRRQYQRVLSTLRSAGIHVHQSEDLTDTIHWVQVLSEWADVENHSTLDPIAESVKGSWGERKRKHYQMQVLMGLPGVGKGLAERIVDVVGGLPFTLQGEKLQEVRGIGKKKYDKINELFEEDDT